MSWNLFVHDRLVLPMQITLLSHIEYIWVFFLVLYLKTTSLHSLKIMNKSPITEYSDNDIDIYNTTK